jgi:hypothetical protein
VSASIVHGNPLETLLTVLQPSRLLARPYIIALEFLLASLTDSTGSKPSKSQNTNITTESIDYCVVGQVSAMISILVLYTASRRLVSAMTLVLVPVGTHVPFYVL